MYNIKTVRTKCVVCFNDFYCNFVMSINSTDIITIKQNYDTTNPLLAKILQAKEERLKVLQKLNEQQREEIKSIKAEEALKKAKKADRKLGRKPETGFPQIALRRSLRIENSVRYTEDQDFEPEPISRKTPIERPPNDYGPMPGVDVGFHWETRLECSRYGVHRPTVAGIHGGPEGAYSIALSGGYPEDVDEGDTFIYTGAGGRDLKGTPNNPKNLRTAAQTRNQELGGTNLSLVKSIESKLPVRVIRGYKSPSFFAPKTGYRYDGLYQVVDYWEDIGTTGFRVYRFKMVRMKDQPPAPWDKDFHRYKKERIKDKENIPPLDDASISSNNSNNDEVELNNVNNEIQMCVNLLFKISPCVNNYSLKENCSAEEFLGWD